MGAILERTKHTIKILNDTEISCYFRTDTELERASTLVPYLSNLTYSLVHRAVSTQLSWLHCPDGWTTKLREDNEDQGMP